MKHISRAFAPGHITGLFEPILKKNNPKKSGSRGAGFSIKMGATSQASITNSIDNSIKIFINNQLTQAPVTHLALTQLLGANTLSLQIDTILDLPTANGFGMSGAGALSASLATANLLDISRSKAIEAAHTAEVLLHTGLGDVIASTFGGIEIRKEPGLPPWGIIEHIPGYHQIVLCVLDKKIYSKTLLQNPSFVDKIKVIGNECLKKIIQSPNVKTFFEQSNIFSQKTGLQTPKINSALKSIKDISYASQCMLGNSIFAIGDTEQLIKRLSSYGTLYVTTIDKAGARILSDK